MWALVVVLAGRETDKVFLVSSGCVKRIASIIENL